MSFDQPWALWLLLLVPGLFLFVYWTLRQFGRFEASEQFRNFTYRSNTPSGKLRWLVGTARLLAVTLLVAGLAQPFVHLRTTEKKYKNVRLFFLVDVSLSMVYGEDVQPNRMAAAKEEIAEAYNRLEGVYEASLIPFAGDPNPYYCPLTYSRSAFLSHLREMSGNSAPSRGTEIPAALEVFTKDIYKGDNLDRPGVNLVVLISDGGKDDSFAVDRPRLFSTVQKLSSDNFRVYTVGVGGAGPTPLIRRDSKGNFQGYVLDGSGAVYNSELDEEILRTIAEEGKGSYMRYGEKGQLYPFLERVIRENGVVDTEQTVTKRVSLDSYFFLTASVLLLVAGLANRRRRGQINRPGTDDPRPVR